MINSNKRYALIFEDDIYMIWKKPIDLLEGFIFMSLESLDYHSHILCEQPNEIGKEKVDVLVKLYARAIQVANEILVLIVSSILE